MRSDEFKQIIRDKLTIPQIQFLNLIFENKDKCKKYGDLHQEFPKYSGSKITFETIYNQLYTLGIIHATKDNSICIPKELIPWLKRFKSKKIAEL